MEVVYLRFTWGNRSAAFHQPFHRKVTQAPWLAWGLCCFLLRECHLHSSDPFHFCPGIDTARWKGDVRDGRARAIWKSVQ